MSDSVKRSCICSNLRFVIGRTSQKSSSNRNTVSMCAGRQLIAVLRQALQSSLPVRIILMLPDLKSGATVSEAKWTFAGMLESQCCVK